jgi:hypothetical protein
MEMKKLMAVMAISLLCGGAHAALVPWDAHDPLETSVVRPGAGSFSDAITFTIVGVPVVNSSVVVTNNLPPLLSIDHGSYSLFGFGTDHLMGSIDDVMFSPLGGWSFDGTTGGTQHAVSLSAGDYYFSISGLASGIAGGLYTIASSVNPVSSVPIPPAFLMMMSGLVLLGVFSRSRREKNFARGAIQLDDQQ